MTKRESLPPELLLGTYRLGYDLTKPGQTIPDAVQQLNTNLVEIGCEPSVDPDTVRGSWESAALRLSTPPFSRALRGATQSMIFREESLATTLPPASAFTNESTEDTIWVPSDEVDIEQLVHDSTEGTIWVDEEKSADRQRIATINSGLLRTTLVALAAYGYPESDGKRDMRHEFDEILDALWERGSFNAFPAGKVVGDIMRQSGVRNAGSSIKAMRRFRQFSKSYGLGLAITRVMPDEVIAQ